MDVSRETQNKIDLYQTLLHKWQARINLVSPSTLQDSAHRHFQDSLQLSSFIPEQTKMLDCGSGAGFPGLVLGIARPDLDITLIESDQRKCAFLQTVSRETQTTNVQIINQRLEDYITASAIDLKPDIITARAFAPLSRLIDWTIAAAERKPNLRYVFLKGENIQAEITDANKNYLFEAQVQQSQTHDSGVVLILDKVRRKQP